MIALTAPGATIDTADTSWQAVSVGVWRYSPSGPVQSAWGLGDHAQPIRAAGPRPLRPSSCTCRRRRSGEEHTGRSSPGLSAVSVQGCEELVDHEGRPEETLSDCEHVLPEGVRLLPEEHPRSEDSQAVEGAAASGTPAFPLLMVTSLRVARWVPALQGCTTVCAGDRLTVRDRRAFGALCAG